MMKSRRLTLAGRIVLWNLGLIILIGVFLLVSLNVFVQIMLPAVHVKPNDMLLQQDQEVIVPTIEVNQVNHFEKTLKRMNHMINELLVLAKNRKMVRFQSIPYR